MVYRCVYTFMSAVLYLLCMAWYATCQPPCLVAHMKSHKMTFDWWIKFSGYVGLKKTSAKLGLRYDSMPKDNE